MQADFTSFLPMGTKEAKIARSAEVQTIFKTYSPGVSTDRDNLVYDFDRQMLSARVKGFIEEYNAEVSRWTREGRPKDIDAFVRYDKVKWSENLKGELRRERYARFDSQHLRFTQYRPYCKEWLYYDALLNDRPGLFDQIFPAPAVETENSAICLTDPGSEKPFMALIVNSIADRHLVGAGAGTRCFPFYTYAEDGSNRRENITDWALAQFQEQYSPEVTKRDIFHYVYAVLHSPQYRERYAENLKRELPRIPFVAHETFRTFVDIGAHLAELHLNYEQAKEYRLNWIENKDVPFSWCVTKMQLSKDKTQLKVNESLTLAGIPAECFEYRLGNRSALEWVIDQYQVSTDKRSGITSDPNRADDEEYIVRLVGRVVTVSVETVKLVKALPSVVETTIVNAPTVEVQ
jgi:predicted helicase